MFAVDLRTANKQNRNTNLSQNRIVIFPFQILSHHILPHVVPGNGIQIYPKTELERF